jgi:hypothetical protein
MHISIRSIHPLSQSRDFAITITNSDADEPDAGVPMLDGVRAIRQSLAQLDDSSVVLLMIE